MRRILVIDDDKLFVDLMVHALKERGHHVEFAFEGLSGLKLVAASQFDVIVCDLLMPEIEGVELIRRLRKQIPQIRIVAISSGLRQASSLDILEVAQKFGADHTLRKPFKLSHLVACVEQSAMSDNEDDPRTAQVAVS